MFWKKPEEPTAEEKAKSSAPATKTPPAGSPPQPAVAPVGVQTAQAPAAPPPPNPFKNAEDRLSSRFAKIRSALGPGTVIQGKLSFDSIVRIDGRLSGEVFSSKPLIIGPTGKIDAQIEVAALIVVGEMRGKVKATERVEVWDTGLIEGEIATPVLVVEEGAKFSASCVVK